MGLNVLAALLANGVGFGAATAAVYGTLGAAALRIGASLLLSSAANALASKQRSRATDAKRQLALPSALPWVRFVYGKTRATGSPANFPVRADKCIGFWLLNSRPSHLTAPVIYLDGRPLTYSGDPFDFAGVGAVATNEPFVNDVFRFWIGRGGQTAAPDDIVSGWPQGAGADSELFLASDAMQGCTVLWAVMTAGAQSRLSERWVAMPPTLEVEGEWSLVYDPREAGHDADDPSTWAYSRNHALCAMDALRRNPMRPYLMRNLLAATFDEGADIADEAVTLKAGGTEPRWSCDGTIVFDGSELEDLIEPLIRSGGADLIRAGGQLGYAWGKYRAPDVTLTYVLGDQLEIVDLAPGDNLPNMLRVTYSSPARGFETAELQPWPIPGALAEDGGIERSATIDLPFAGPTQAMRVRKRLGLRMRRQQVLSGGELPPEAIDLLPGATATLTLPAPFDALDGIYEVQSIAPMADPLGEGGVALRMPASLVLADPNEDAWTAATDEEDLIVEPYSGTRAPTEYALADIVEPAALGQSRYITGWRGGDAYCAGNGYWWIDSLTGEIVTPARIVADFALLQYQRDQLARTRGNVISLTRASTATYVDGDGLVATAAVDALRVDYSDGAGALLVESAATNLALQSADFSSASWLKNAGVTVTANAVAGPDGATTGDQVSVTGLGIGIYQSVTAVSGAEYTVSVWLKANSGVTSALIRDDHNAGRHLQVILATGVITGTSGTITAYGSEAYENGWFRYWMQYPTGGTQARLLVRGSAGAAGSWYQWGGQIEAGAVSSHIPTAGAAVTRSPDLAGLQNMTATLDIEIGYADGTTGTVSGASVAPGYWPTLTKTRVRRLIGRTP